jgi:hypothetical protein
MTVDIDGNISLALHGLLVLHVALLMISISGEFAGFQCLSSEVF